MSGASAVCPHQRQCSDPPTRAHRQKGLQPLSVAGTWPGRRVRVSNQPTVCETSPWWVSLVWALKIGLKRMSSMQVNTIKKSSHLFGLSVLSGSGWSDTKFLSAVYWWLHHSSACIRIILLFCVLLISLHFFCFWNLVFNQVYKWQALNQRESHPVLTFQNYLNRNRNGFVS